VRKKKADYPQLIIRIFLLQKIQAVEAHTRQEGLPTMQKRKVE
jgi:hypothetical protein